MNITVYVLLTKYVEQYMMIYVVWRISRSQKHVVFCSFVDYQRIGFTNKQLMQGFLVHHWYLRMLEACAHIEEWSSDHPAMNLCQIEGLFFPGISFGPWSMHSIHHNLTDVMPWSTWSTTTTDIPWYSLDQSQPCLWLRKRAYLHCFFLTHPAAMERNLRHPVVVRSWCPSGRNRRWLTSTCNGSDLAPGSCGDLHDLPRVGSKSQKKTHRSWVNPMKSGSAKWIEVLRVDKNPVKSSYVHMFIIVYPYFCWLDPIQSPFFIGKSHEITIFAGFSIPFPSLFALPSGYVDITEDTDAQLMGIVDEEKERLAPWPQNHVVMSCQVRSGHVCVYIYI